MYIYQHTAWPHFTWDQTSLTPLLLDVRHQQGRLLGYMQALGFQLQEEASRQILLQDVIKTSAIEGETLEEDQVRSSIARHLGIEQGATLPMDRHIDGIVEIMLDATRFYEQPLTRERLFHWHANLFPVNPKRIPLLTVGQWRTDASGPMQVVSGPYGRETIHFEAPDYRVLANEMKQFIKWFNATTPIDFVMKSALAHFWFVTIHPFEDGNGRIARALADMLLARSENCAQRFYSMSAQIQRERHAYYTILESCQKGSLDITAWMEWYLQCMKHAIAASEETLHTVIKKARFWSAHTGATLNERQRNMVNRLLDGFDGHLNSSKWAKIMKCSQDTALRDINDLVAQGLLIKNESGGRSTHYQLHAPLN